MDHELIGGYLLGDVYRSPDGLYATVEVQRADGVILTVNTARLRRRWPGVPNNPTTSNYTFDSPAPL